MTISKPKPTGIMTTQRTAQLLGVATLSMLAFSGCTNEEKTTAPPTTAVVLQNHSATPAFVKKLAGFEGLEVFSLIGSDDKLAESPNYVFTGSADGAGLLKNADGTFTMLVNHEDNFAVSRVTLDKTFKPVKGEYLLNSTGGIWRLCSATMATPEEHGFGPTFLTCGESGEDSQTHALDPLEINPTASKSKAVAALGQSNAENAMPLNKNAYAGKTIVIIGDDDSRANGGQVLMYVGNTVGDLQNGSLYMLRRKDLNQRELDFNVGAAIDVEFVKIDNHIALKGSEINARVDVLKAIKFGRVEDLDYRKGSAANNREVYFNVTGQDGNADRSKYGRVYKLNLDAADPLKGKLELVLNGDDRTGIAKEFQNVDNIYVGENYLYTQEDPNSYGDETHDAYIYQYNLGSKELKKVVELDHRRTAADKEKYNRNTAGTTYVESRFGAWEYGAMIDISKETGIANTFAICIQPHSWRGDAYKGKDGGTIRPDENQASQIIIIKGLPK